MVIDHAWLLELAPHLFSVRRTEPSSLPKPPEKKIRRQ